MNYITFQTIVVLGCLAAGCGKQGVIPDAGLDTPNTAAQAPVNNTSPTPDTASEGTDVSVTVYSKTMTAAPQAGWATKTYTATGYCANYNSKTYCWDDGVKTLSWSDFSGNHYGPFTYTFWNMSKNLVGWSSASGGLQADLMPIPRWVNTTLSNNLNNPMASVNTVVSTGSASNYDCVDTDGIVDCGNFVIDTTQAGL